MATVNDFLYVYFYQLERDLNANCDGLDSLKFQSEEANTDEEVKSFFKRYISNHNKIRIKDINRLIVTQDSDRTEVNVEDLSEFYISNVVLPNELTSDMKSKIAATKKSVYTNPDLYLQVTDSIGRIEYISIELKSTKNNAIPGSSVQQVSPSEWVIFVKHTDIGDVEVSCGFYINTITEKLPFPDRSPRPIIGFNTLKKWNETNRKVYNNILQYTIDTQAEQNKTKILENWEQVLCDEWLHTIETDANDREKWFNNTIRMYTLQLLKMVESDSNLANKLIEKLSKNIKG